jgi:hypothetical protein
MCAIQVVPVHKTSLTIAQSDYAMREPIAKVETALR